MFLDHLRVRSGAQLDWYLERNAYAYNAFFTRFLDLVIWWECRGQLRKDSNRLLGNVVRKYGKKPSSVGSGGKSGR